MAIGIPTPIEKFIKKFYHNNKATGRIIRRIYEIYLVYVFSKYVSILLLYRRRVNDIQFNTDIKPVQIKYVSPNDIKHKMKKGEGFKKYNAGGVEPGYWDKNSEKFEDFIIYKSIKNHFKNGKKWQETELYKKMLGRVQKGGTHWHGCNSESDIKDRCDMLDSMFEEIAEVGYKSQAEIENNTNNIDPSHSIYPPELREVGINIGRDGELILEDGRHRLSIAKILGLDEIPVAIIVRHEKWQMKKEKGETPKTHIDGE